MGICSSTQGIEATPEDEARHREVETAMEEAKAKLGSTYTLLVLGSGDSGKSTILKQLRLEYGLKLSEDELESYRHLVFDNITCGLRLLLIAMQEMGIEVSPENIGNLDYVLFRLPKMKGGQPFPEACQPPLAELWADPNVKTAYERGNEAAIPENLSYFFNDLDRLFASEYKPSRQDIVQCPAWTTGINEMTFKVDKERELLVVDVGGQRGERRKWIHCFQNVTAVLFVVSLTGYDQCLLEDKDANQMQDAMTIWQGITHSQWFKRTKFILLWNKNDLFERRISQSSVTKFFPDYDGDASDPLKVRQYFTKRFLSLAGRNEGLYTYTITATHTLLLKAIMFAVQDIVIRTNLQELRLLC